jgi:hypothetical protein
MSLSPGRSIIKTVAIGPMASKVAMNRRRTGDCNIDGLSEDAEMSARERL